MIRMIVANPEFLQFGNPPTQVFSNAGGTLGSARATWMLGDVAGRVAPLHAEVVRVDGAWCVIDRSGGTWLNDARDPLGRNRIVALSHGDVLRVGPYRIKVRLDEDPGAVDDGMLPPPLWVEG